MTGHKFETSAYIKNNKFDSDKLRTDLIKIFDNDNIIFIWIVIYNEYYDESLQVIFGTFSEENNNCSKILTLSGYQKGEFCDGDLLFLNETQINMFDNFLTHNKTINTLFIQSLVISQEDYKNLNKLFLNNKHIKKIQINCGGYAEIFKNVNLELLIISSTNYPIRIMDLSKLLLYPSVKSIKLKLISLEHYNDKTFSALQFAFNKTNSLIDLTLEYNNNKIINCDTDRCFFSSDNKSIKKLSIKFNTKTSKHASSIIRKFVSQNTSLISISVDHKTIPILEAIMENKSIQTLKLIDNINYDEYILYLKLLEKVILVNKSITNLVLNVHCVGTPGLTTKIYEQFEKNKTITDLTLYNIPTTEHCEILLKSIQRSSALENIDNIYCHDKTHNKWKEILKEVNKIKKMKIQYVEDNLIEFASYDIKPMIKIINDYLRWILKN